MGCLRDLVCEVKGNWCVSYAKRDLVYMLILSWNKEPIIFMSWQKGSSVFDQGRKDNKKCHG